VQRYKNKFATLNVQSYKPYYSVTHQWIRGEEIAHWIMQKQELDDFIKQLGFKHVAED